MRLNIHNNKRHFTKINKAFLSQCKNPLSRKKRGLFPQAVGIGPVATVVPFNVTV